MQDYKSLCAAVTVCATLINRSVSDLLHGSKSPAEKSVREQALSRRHILRGACCLLSLTENNLTEERPHKGRVTCKI